MAIYAIGDVQGCFDELRRLLEIVAYDSNNDTLWFTGDLVNRGPQSLAVMRFVKGLGERAVTVLGNHDLHMLAVAEDTEKYRKNDTFRDILDAPDAAELLTWLRHQPLLYYDTQREITLVHAGLVPQWDVPRAHELAGEVEAVLRGEKYHKFFANMYGNKPDRWDEGLQGWERLRFITNTFTRLRFCDHQGHKLLKEKGPVGTQPTGYLPWFEVPERKSRGATIVFGHWAALGAAAHPDNVYSVDSGCAWGGSLSALRIDGERQFFSLPCEAKAPIE